VLLSVGALQQHATEFGETSIAVDLGSCIWRSQLCAGDPLNILELPSSAGGSGKLDLVLQLVREGWTGVAALALPPISHDGDRTFAFPMLFRSRLYFSVLLSADAIFGKGAASIFHNMPHYYYQCLLSLKDLSVLPPAAELVLLGNKAFQALLQGRAMPEELLALADDDGAELLAIADGVDDGEAVEEPPPPIPLVAFVGPSLAGADALAKAMDGVEVRDEGQLYTIRFDGFSHASGIQRGYTRCHHHMSCFRYTQVTMHSSRADLIGYLCAWAEMGPAISREDHQSRGLDVPAARQLHFTSLVIA
jgi:hypothetical protein